MTGQASVRREIAVASVDLDRATDEAGQRAVAAELDHAFGTLGFATIRNRGILIEVFERIYAIARDFFHQDEAEKRRWLPTQPGLFRGYSALGTHRSAVGSHRADATRAPGDLGETFMIARVDGLDDPSYHQPDLRTEPLALQPAGLPVELRAAWGMPAWSHAERAAVRGGFAADPGPDS